MYQNHDCGGKAAVLNLIPIEPMVRESFLGAFNFGYFDESGKANQRIVSFCGFVCAEERWPAFCHEWNYWLRHYKKPHLHLSSESLRASPKDIQMYRQFIGVIRNHIEAGFGVAVDAVAFESALHRAVRADIGDDPHFLAFARAIDSVLKYSVGAAGVSIVCDEDEEKACDCYKLWRRFRKRKEEHRKILKSITFADDASYPQLQAADLFSWVVRAESLRQFKGDSFSLSELYGEFFLSTLEKRIKYPEVGIWDEETLRQFSARTLPRLKKR